MTEPKDPNIELGKLPGFVNLYEGYTLEQALASVGVGWAPLIERVFAAKPADRKIVQVKEKFGTLTIYTDTYDWDDTKPFGEKVVGFSKFLDDIENESGKTCEWCGKPGTLDKSYGWLLTLCRSCKRKRTKLRGILG